jgi:type IV secretion system protein VirB1
MMPSFEMMQHCAPTVAPATMAAIIQVESGGNPLALGINGPLPIKPHPHTVADAARLARYSIHLGYSVDLGLMQINSRNLKGLGLSIEAALEPCRNLQAGSQILERGYAGAVKRYGHGQTALKAALSAYNTGNYERGFQNGYVAKYYDPGITMTIHANIPKPGSVPFQPKSSLAMPVQTLASAKSPLNPYEADTTVYKRVTK